MSESLSAAEPLPGMPVAPDQAPGPDGAQRARERFRRAVREAGVSEGQVRVIVGAGEDFAARCVELWARPPKGKRSR